MHSHAVPVQKQIRGVIIFCITWCGTYQGIQTRRFSCLTFFYCAKLLQNTCVHREAAVENRDKMKTSKTNKLLLHAPNGYTDPSESLSRGKFGFVQYMASCLSKDVLVEDVSAKRSDSSGVGLGEVLEVLGHVLQRTYCERACVHENTWLINYTDTERAVMKPTSHRSHTKRICQKSLCMLESDSPLQLAYVYHVLTTCICPTFTPESLPWRACRQPYATPKPIYIYVCV